MHMHADWHRHIHTCMQGWEQVQDQVRPVISFVRLRFWFRGCSKSRGVAFLSVRFTGCRGVAFLSVFAHAPEQCPQLSFSLGRRTLNI